MGLIPGSGRCPGGGNGNPLQYSFLGNPMDRGAWWTAYSSWGSNESDMTEHVHIAVTVPTIFTSINFSHPFSFASILCFLCFLYFMILQLESKDKLQVIVWLALVFVHVYVLSRLSPVRLLWPCELQPSRLLCPSDSPGKNTGVGCHALLQGTLPTRLLVRCLLH